MGAGNHTAPRWDPLRSRPTWRESMLNLPNMAFDIMNVIRVCDCTMVMHQ